MDSPSEKRTEDDSLVKGGWRRQFAADEPRLSEAVEMYRTAGFEVRLEPLRPEPECKSISGAENKAECRVCYEGFEERYKVIYTRPKKMGSDSQNDLF